MIKPKLERCPICGSIFIDWDRIQKVWRCLVRKCGWTSDRKTTNSLERRIK